MLTWKLRIWGFQNWPYFNIWKLPNQSYEPLKTNRDFYKHPVSINSHFGLFYFLSYCHISLHISDNLSPNLTSRDILRKKRTRAFIWHQSWWDFRLYCWRYGLLKSVRIYLTDPVYWFIYEFVCPSCSLKSFSFLYAQFNYWSWTGLSSLSKALTDNFSTSPSKSTSKIKHVLFPDLKCDPCIFWSWFCYQRKSSACPHWLKSGFIVKPFPNWH